MASNSPTVRVGFLGDASQLAREARRAQDSLDGISKHAHTTSTALGTALGTVAGKGIGAIASAAKNAVGSIGALASTSIQAASDMNESLSKNQAVFGSSADSVKAWASDNTKNILLTKQAAIEGAASFGNLFVALGLGQAPAAQLSTSLVGLASDLSSFNNVGTDEALLALRSGLLGEAEPLRKFGVSLSATRIEAEALALGLAKPVKNAAAISAAHNAVAAAATKVAAVEKEHGKGTLAASQAQDGLARANANLTKVMGGTKVELTAAQKAQAAYSIIVKDTKTAAGDATRTQDGYANSTKILHKNIGDLEASIGQKLLPHALRLTHAISDLVVEFDNGTGTGGEIRDALAGIGETARGLGEDLKPVGSVVRWFAQHPDAMKGIVEGMVLFAAASKSAAIWNTRLAGSTALTGVAAGTAGVARTAPLAALGLGAMGGSVVALLQPIAMLAGSLAATYGVLERISDLAKGLGGDIGPLLNRSTFGLGNRPGPDKSTQAYIDGLSPEKRKQFYGWYPELGPATLSGPYQRHAPQVPDDYDAKTSATLAQKTGAAASRSDQAVREAAKRSADAQKAATDKVMAQQKYAADQAEKAAKIKAAAADALQKATDKLQQALDDRKQMAQGVHDSLVSSVSLLREGASWTAKDLLSRFQLGAGKLQRFQAGLAGMARLGFGQSIIQQAAQGGLSNLGAVVGLSHASTAQVRQANATQAAIDRYAARAGDVAARSMGPINISLYLDGKKLAPDLVRVVNDWNARAGRNGSRLVA